MAAAGLTLSTKDKKSAVKLRMLDSDSRGAAGEASTSQEVVLGEPLAFYQLPEGEVLWLGCGAALGPAPAGHGSCRLAVVVVVPSLCCAQTKSKPIQLCGLIFGTHAHCPLPAHAGGWYLEYAQLYTAGQAQALAEARGLPLSLPLGFDRSSELLRSTARQHALLEDILGRPSFWHPFCIFPLPLSFTLFAFMRGGCARRTEMQNALSLPD